MDLGGILLTGGTSSRMGRDKASLLIDGTTLAERTARIMDPFVALAVEVGGGVSSLPAVRESSPGSGPLGAIAAGYAALVSCGLPAGVGCLIVSCDLPKLTAQVLDRLANWRGNSSVMPVIDGFAQPLCARWSAVDLGRAGAAFASGERSLRSLPDRRTAVLLTERELGEDDPVALSDVDTPEDLLRLGLCLEN